MDSISRLVTRARTFTRYARLKPFTGDGDDAQRDERSRRWTLGVVSAVGARAINVGSSFVSIPLALKHLGDERYGLWLSVVSFVAMFSFADLGIGNGLVNAIASAHGRNDREAAAAHVTNALVMVSAIGAALLLGCFAIAPFVNWADVFTLTTTTAINEALPTVLAVVATTVIGLPLGLVNRIQLGYQDSFNSNVWQAVGAALSMIGLIVALMADLGTPGIVLIMTASPLLAALINSVVVLRRSYPWIRPRWRLVSKASAMRLARIGFMFFILQLAVAVAYTADNLVCAHVLGADQVPQYAVPFRLFSLPNLVLSLLLTPLWPAYGEAIARRDHEWIRKTLVRSVRSSIALSLAGGVFLLIVARPVIRAWASPAIQPSWALLIGLALWCVISGVGAAYAVFLNAMNAVRFQAWFASLMAAANIITSIILARHFGVAGIIWGTVLAYTVFSLIPCAVYVRSVVNGKRQLVAVS